MLAVIKSAWADGSVIARGLFSEQRAPVARHELRIAVALTAGFTAAFIVFFVKSLAWFKYLPEQHWAQAMVDYDIDWRTPVFALGGNLLYGFGIQVPLNGQLLPMEAIAHLFPIQVRIAAIVALCFLSASLLFWCIGVAIGLKLIYRIVFVGASALIAIIPVGLSYVLWLLPPMFITYNFIGGVWAAEATILCLFGAFLFFLVGQLRSVTKNLCAGAGFALAAFGPVLSYPYWAVYSIPILALYCFGLFLTSENRNEFYWKAGVSVAVIAFMVIARVPQYVSNLYSYAFATYFFEFSPEPPASFGFSSLAAVFIYYFNDPRGLVSFTIALAALATAAYAAKGALRRIAIVILVCEGAIIAVTTINLWTWRVPLRGDYAELAHAPMWCAFFVLSMMIFAMLLDQRLVEWGNLARAKYSSLIQRAIHSRHWVYCSFFALTIAGYAVFQAPPKTLSDYPPRQTPLSQLLAQELSLAPGLQFRGRLMTLVPGDLKGPADPSMFYDMLNNYRRYLGNDLWVDPLAFNIPILNEFGHFSSPVTFALARIFFGKEGDEFDRTTVVFSRFDLRIARLLGVKMVATDASTIPGGTFVYDAKAGDTDLRIFRIDDVNLGQYSPIRPRYVRTAADAIAAIKAVDFDPKLDVVVESQVGADLAPATSSGVTVDRGPALIVRATSPSRSLLVLPFEFSHCLEMKVMEGQAQLLPVNLQQTGLLFDDKVEAENHLSVRPFSDSRCRGEDHRRADDLRLKEALVQNDRATPTRTRPSLW